jgi:hypothetical protein
VIKAAPTTDVKMYVPYIEIVLYRDKLVAL